MKRIMNLFMIFLLMALSHISFSQEINYIDAINQTFVTEHHHHHYTQYLHSSHNELQVVFSSIFLMYKTFISSQDMNACVFYPSCSEYAIQSIQKKGFVVGFLTAMDRLTRCHPLAATDNHYPYDIKRMKLYDPVE